MTENDEDAALGRMVSRFSEAKTRRAALMLEVQRIGDLLKLAGDSLGRLDLVDAFWDGRPNGYARNRSDLYVRAYPDVSGINALLDELRAVSAELQQVRGLIKDAGLNVE